MLWIAAAQAGVLRHAIVVGANLGGGSLEPLRYAESDAQRMAETLVELGGFDPSFVTVLYAPSPDAIREAVHDHEAIAQRHADDLFFFYYSGHADARGLRLAGESMGFEDLRSSIRAMPAEVKLGVLDACRSGTITRLKGAALSQPFIYEDRIAAEGEAWLTAASADEEAQESDQLRGSFFTHYLLSGLRGAADTGDGTVSLQEAYNYAYDRVVDHTGGTVNGAQHPSFDYRLQGQGELTITTLEHGRATATLPPEIAGQVTVLRLPDRTPVAEVAKKEGAPVTLALTPGSYKLRLVQGRELRESEVMLTDGARVTISRWGVVGAEVATKKGEVILDPRELAREGVQTGKNLFVQALRPEDLRHSPLLAGGISATLPGGGQYYNGQWFKGTVYLVGTSVLLTSSLFRPGSSFFEGAITGPDPLMMGAMMFYGAAVADASYNAYKYEDMRPRKGVTLSTAAAWDPSLGWNTPFVAGINVDWVLVPNVSIGVDRLGWTMAPDGSGRWNAGTRAMFAIEGTRVRPALFVNFGLRYFDRDETLVGVAGGGVDFRWYISPRYFLDFEGRVEAEDGHARVTTGGGLGLHLGK